MTIKILFTIAILFFWVLVTIFAVTSIVKIWRIDNVNSKITLKLAWKELTESINPFKTITGWIKEDASLEMDFRFMESYTFTPEGNEIINSEFLIDRKQYSFSISNKSNVVFHDIIITTQFPYPVEKYEIIEERNASGISYMPFRPEMTIIPHGEGAGVTFSKKPLFTSYDLKIKELNKKGRVEILILINSWRDPRGKTISDQDRGRYFIPEAGYDLNFIYGDYFRIEKEDSIKIEYYAALEFDSTKLIILNPEIPKPDTLMRKTGFQ